MDASKEGASLAANTTERGILATRVFDAPRDLVWKVWTEPEHIWKWWGPKGFSDTIKKMDLKPGGAWEHVRHGPDGKNYENKTVYVEVVKPERLVYDHLSHPSFRATVTLEKLAKEFEAVEGLSQTFGRLEEHLASSPVIVDGVLMHRWRGSGKQLQIWTK
jgi:hypothetical protein